MARSLRIAVPKSLLILLWTLFALSVHAQDEEDIAYTLDMPEAVVLANGMTFEEYLLQQVLANAKPLSARTQTLDYSVTCKLEKDIDLKKFPHRRVVTFAARLAGYGPILSALREHKHFGITMAEDVHYADGKTTATNVRMVEMKQELTPKQVASFLKHDDMLSANVYDKFYKKVREKVRELQKKRQKKQDTGMKYEGSYTANEKLFYVVKLGSMTVHIADGCWQIARLSYNEGQNYLQHEFREVKPDLYLLSHGTARFYLDRAKWPKGYMLMEINYTYK
jgi:hypothetical protein